MMEEATESEQEEVLIDVPPSRLERFGLFVFSLFPKAVGAKPFSISDEELNVHCFWVLLKGLFLCSIVSVLDVLPTVELEVYLRSIMWPKLWITVFTAVLTGLLLLPELLLLFIIALYCAHQLANFLQIQDDNVAMMGVFNSERLLARAALELDDPQVRLESIDPFRSINRWSLLLLGLLYKLKIVLSNLVLKLLVGLAFGEDFPMYFISFAVEVFWNCVVLYKVVIEGLQCVFSLRLLKIFFV
jgi:hypothetical protein